MPDYASTIAECWRNAGGDGAAAAGGTPEKPSEFRIGPYEIRGVLGRGGQGVVYAAVDTRLGRSVALKVLDGAIAFSKDSIRRFRDEARNTARLEHPGICTLYDAGIHEGRPFIAMRRIEGATLAERIRRRFATDDSAPAEGVSDSSAREAETPALAQRIAIVVPVVEKVARALGFAHGLGVVHHDVKPGNIIIDRTGDPVLVDFGVAKSVEDETRSMTRSLAVTGTLPYLAPELLDPATSFVGPAADLWSLGVVLYEALTLRRPFEALTAEGMREAIREGRRRKPGPADGGMPADLKAIVDKALAPDPRFRYASAMDLAEDLRRFRSREPVLARRPSRSRRVLRWAARNRAAAALIGVLSVIVAAVAAWTLVPGGVSVASSPGGATIFVDGADSGLTTPALVRIWPFRRVELELRLPGHRPERVASTGVRFETERLGPIALVPETGRLRITTAQAGLSAVLRRRGAAAPGREEVRLALSGDDVVTLEAGGWDLAVTGKNLADRRWTVEVPERGAATHNVSLARLRSRPEIRVAGEVPFRVDAGDFDGDGHEDLLLHHRASSGPSRVEVFSGWSSEPLWSRALGNENSSIVGLIDANGDGLPEVCCVEDFDRQRVLLLSGRTGRSFGELSCAAEVAGARIVPGDGPSAARVLLWSVEPPGAAGSTPIVRFQLFDPATRASVGSWALSSAPPVVVRTEDLDGDGTREICAGLPDGQIAVLERGTPGRARFFHAGPGELVGLAVVGDRDGDGVRDLVVAMRGTAPSPTGDAVESIRFETVGRNRTELLWNWSAPTTPNDLIRIELLVGCDAGERPVRIVTACEWRPTPDQRAFEVYEVEAGDGGSSATARRLASFGAWFSSTQLDLDGDGRKELAFLGGPESSGSRIADRAVLTVVPATGKRAPRSRELPGIAEGVIGSRATLEGRRRDLVLLTTSLAESRTLLAEIWSGTRLLDAESGPARRASTWIATAGWTWSSGATTASSARCPGRRAPNSGTSARDVRCGRRRQWGPSTMMPLPTSSSLPTTDPSSRCRAATATCCGPRRSRRNAGVRRRRS